MTTGRPESDPYGDSGDRDWNPRPAVPGWTAGQDYTGPLFDDTGWHIDLSDVDWGDNTGRDWADDRTAGADAAFRFKNQDPYGGNGAGPATADYDRPVEPPDWSGPSGGRHARRVRPPDEQAGFGSPQPPVAPRRVSGQPPPRAQPRRVVPSAYQQPPAAEPRPYDAPPYDAPPYDAPPFDAPPYDAPPFDAPPYEPGPSEPDAYEPPPGFPAPPYPPRGYQPPGRGSPSAQPPVYEEPGYKTRRRPIARPRRPADGGSASIVRSSGVMAVGTLGSRLTGFLRTLVQNYALGAVGIAEAYNLSNTLPNVVYNLALGGILTSVIVPLIVAASRRGSDRGEGYDQRMFTLITAALLGITVIATLAAVPIVHLYRGSQITGRTEQLAVIFAFFFIPQIFFYGVSSLIGAILNSRGSFAAPMWTPIINNFVVIAVLGLYIAMGGLTREPRTITGTEVALLGFGTTLGIVVQTAALVPALRRVGFRWQPRLDFRRAEVAEIGRMGGWMFGYVAATQVAFLVTTKVAGDTGNGITVYNYAWLLFQLPYAVVGISVITALLPRMSAHATQRRFGLVRQDFSIGVRLAATIVVPCSLVLAVLGPKLGEVFFAHGKTHLNQAHYMGVVFAVFCLGLLPYMIFQLQLRVFYSVHDSKTPALIGLATMIVNIVANLIALSVLPKSQLVAGLGAGFGVANLFGLLIAWRILSTRLRGLDGYRIGRTLVRMYAATLPAALLAVLVGLVTPNAYVVVIIGGGLAAGMYLMFARLLRIEELSSLGRTMLARVGR
ncbi:MAG TPA: murein biosynthesis integral membrane protein MurJ [Streptosporangiaceae bacterium]|nr:murein biosynthesis integral membrane protein MurJ [Streptosporangiaceae bacterium]